MPCICETLESLARAAHYSTFDLNSGFWQVPSKCDVFKSEINYLAHHVSQKGVHPSKKNLESIAQCLPPDTYTKVKSFVGLVGHYRCFIKGFAKIAAPLYDLTSGDNKDKKWEHVDLSPEAREAFDCLKTTCLQAPILAFPDFNKPFLLEMDASRRGLGAILSQKQADGRYHPIAYASHVMNETEQRYHSNKQEFLALKWAITEQFHEYLSPYGRIGMSLWSTLTTTRSLISSHLPIWMLQGSHG